MITFQAVISQTQNYRTTVKPVYNEHLQDLRGEYLQSCNELDLNSSFFQGYSFMDDMYPGCFVSSKESTFNDKEYPVTSGKANKLDAY